MPLILNVDFVLQVFGGTCQGEWLWDEKMPFQGGTIRGRVGEPVMVSCMEAATFQGMERGERPSIWSYRTQFCASCLARYAGENGC